ncbi:MAG: hypothetical protein L0312_30675 [Acidobacteria bacterium]|nr:hypothetical protein [Acidobacteriota bacterium]
MKLKPSLFLCIATVALFSASVQAQLTIDATGPQKEPRKTSSGGCASIGRKLPLKLAVEIHGGPTGDKGETVVEFLLTNSGKEGLRIPVSPDPSDVEPADSNATYTLRRLALYIVRQEKILPEIAFLYGSDESATLTTLAPGDSIRVRAKVALPRATGSRETDRATLIAHASLKDETIMTVNGKPSRDCFEVGYAKSDEYTLEASGDLRVSSAPEERRRSSRHGELFRKQPAAAAGLCI